MNTLLINLIFLPSSAMLCKCRPGSTTESHQTSRTFRIQIEIIKASRSNCYSEWNVCFICHLVDCVFMHSFFPGFAKVLVSRKQKRWEQTPVSTEKATLAVDCEGNFRGVQSNGQIVSLICWERRYNVHQVFVAVEIRANLICKHFRSWLLFIYPIVRPPTELILCLHVLHNSKFNGSLIKLQNCLQFPYICYIHVPRPKTLME